MSYRPAPPIHGMGYRPAPVILGMGAGTVSDDDDNYLKCIDEAASFRVLANSLQSTLDHTQDTSPEMKNARNELREQIKKLLAIADRKRKACIDAENAWQRAQQASQAPQAPSPAGPLPSPARGPQGQQPGGFNLPVPFFQNLSPQQVQQSVPQGYLQLLARARASGGRVS